jgi:hypothetical protein
MERLNLNVPADVRQVLKQLAADEGKREAEVARELLVDAVKRAARARFLRDCEDAMRDPALRKRLREITTAMEKMRGGSR